MPKTADTPNVDKWRHLIGKADVFAFEECWGPVTKLEEDKDLFAQMMGYLVVHTKKRKFIVGPNVDHMGGLGGNKWFVMGPGGINIFVVGRLKAGMAMMKTIGDPWPYETVGA